MAELVTLGETMLRLSPPTGERLETATRLECRTAGAESNVAIAASRLGTDAAWLSKLPESPLGRRVVGDVQRHGVDPLIAWSEDGRQGTYYLEQGGEPRATDVIYDRADAAITSATTGDLAVEAVEDAELFFTTGITPALSDTCFETTRQLLEVADRTAFDLNYRSKLWSDSEAASAYEALLRDVDVLFAPERDVESILGIDGQPRTVAETLRDRFGCETVVLTRGEHGALARTPAGTVEQPAIDADTLDPIGTGDAFVGGYLSRILDGEAVERALAYGAATAALKRTITGDLAVVTERAVERVLDDRTTDIER
ncbi:PfkB domain-containing protein [Salinarchaeum sp. Harcht-Bsk1]|uniref:bifunctional 2-dehydro-3-deoxygluconokinase/2-dehydro-3- deoxygalactonokinase n=1 Tax=Salinarchaeum sp. Harcht-Bsk1 TaxID=1333523 RepID=UPI000342498E|nr:bifunctional 2-dehydro-3-deoxygluconokinase/2-dehydro-3-deoxygalactonokinase [Salinarchaeum sp. Harcht-Bsk1]AGN02756.1 PfkB domain-containing protein [Salinarchaeum sp. Harcht-Bsk1]